MTSSIQRYGIRHDVLKGTPDGEFVTYKDHERIVSELQAKVAAQNTEIGERTWRELLLRTGGR